MRVNQHTKIQTNHVNFSQREREREREREHVITYEEHV